MAPGAVVEQQPRGRVAHLLPQNSVSGQLVAVERIRQPVALAEVVGVRGFVLDDDVAGRCVDQRVQVAAPLVVADAQCGVVLVPVHRPPYQAARARAGSSWYTLPSRMIPST